MTDWIRLDTALAIHDEQIAVHGGGTGLRDLGLLESALARRQNLAAYGDPELCALAASLAFGIARNHPFVDGNKRTAYVAAEAFLRLNGIDLTADDAYAVVATIALASDEISESEFAQWLRDNTKPRS